MFQNSTITSSSANHKMKSIQNMRYWKFGVATMIFLIMTTLEMSVYTISSMPDPVEAPSDPDVPPDPKLLLDLDLALPRPNTTCAINLFGLPRAFRQLVLPSMIRNIIPWNDCDYYVHYYYKTEEAAGRSGQGGVIEPSDIRLLEEAVQKHSPNTNRTPIVEFTVDTEEDFWKQYTPLLEKIRTTKVPETGRLLYYPWKEETYVQFTTTDNIVKMWHSIQSSWNLMEQSEKSRHLHYRTVAMLRSDVVYVTKLQVDAPGRNASTVAIPAFGKHPLSDRAIYGNYDAVKIWSTQRLPRLDDHVRWVAKHHPGWGMHSEKFMNWTIFSQMRDILREDPYWCFLRARADISVWVGDCEFSADPSIRKHVGNIRRALESAIGRSCPGNITQLTPLFKTLNCTAVLPVATGLMEQADHQ